MSTARTIVVVDDDEITCFLNKSVLESMQLGVSVMCFTDAKEAILFLGEMCSKDQGCKAAEFDLIFLDIQMGGMDGYEFLELLEQSKAIDKSHTFVIALTSFVSDRTAESLKVYSVHGVYQKPLTSELVEEILSTLPSYFT